MINDFGYYQSIVKNLEQVNATQGENIQKAASLMADAIAEDRLIHVYGGGGHTTLCMGEMFFRAGGLSCINPVMETGLSVFNQALKYLELCYVDQLFLDTMRYGVQGYHWNYVTEEQNPTCAGGVLRTQVGSDNYNPWGFSQPAYFNTSIAVSQDQIDGTAPAPVFEQYQMYYDEVAKNANVSTLNGFVFDISAWDAQMAEINNIYAEYGPNYKCGLTPIDDILPEMMEKLNAAGLQDIIADAQAQLDKHMGK